MAHTFANLLTHVIFSTKDRQPLISRDLKPDLLAYMGGIVRELQGKCAAANSMPDHVHMLLWLSPTMAIAEAVRIVKTNSSRWVHRNWPAAVSPGRGATARSASASRMPVRW